MVMNVASMASAIKQQQLGIEIGARLAKTAKDQMEVEGDALLKLLDSSELMNAALQTGVGTVIDIQA